MINVFLFTILIVLSFSNSLVAQDNLKCKVFFKTDRAKLETAEVLKLTDFIKSMGTPHISEIIVSGYCDDLGSDDYNFSLSKKRANYIKEKLINLNFDNDIIVVHGNGELPVLRLDSNTIEQQRTYNKRVEIAFVKNIKHDSLIKSVISINQKVGDKINLENVLFESSHAVLLPKSFFTLDKLVEDLKEHKEYQIIILGHACCEPPGQDGYDANTGLRNLSVVRAKAVYDYLVTKGIDTNRLEYKGLKVDYPTGKGEKYDKRVEIMITNIIKE